MTHYRLYNHVTGAVLYLLSISNDREVDHQERLEKKNLILTENPPYCLCAVIGRASHKTLKQ